jgi:hypothetical protein
MTEAKKPTAGSWITVLFVAVLVGYPLSFGPACWLSDRDVLPTVPLYRAYRPLLRIVVRESPVISGLLERYGTAMPSRREYSALWLMCEMMRLKMA